MPMMERMTYRANLLLEKLDEIEASAEFKQRVTAECKFLRAYFYTELVRFFENIPLLTATIKVENMIANSDRALHPDYSEIFRKAGEFSTESVLEIPHGDSPAWWDWGYLRGSEGNLAAQLQGPRVTGSENWNRGL